MVSLKKVTLYSTSLLWLIESAGTNRVPRLGRYKLTDEAVLLAETLVFVSLHCPHVLQVDCGQNTAWHVRKPTKDRGIDLYGGYTALSQG